MQCLDCKERGPDTVPASEEKDGSRPGQGKVAVPCTSLHREAVGRRLREGVEIVAGNQTILLNSKEEFLQGAVPSTRTQRGFGQ